MVRSLLNDPNYRLQFGGHETFPLRYGWLKKAYDSVKTACLLNEKAGSSVFNEDLSIARFGVGKNMVLSIRHWALAADIIESIEIPGERASHIRTGALGDLLFGEALDPYLEHPASIWLLHWTLSCLPSRASAWHWAFNEFHEPTFDRELMVHRLIRRCEALNESGRLARPVSDTTIRRDIDCLIRMYHAAPVGGGRRAPEDSIESPLAELGLIQKAGFGESYRFRRGPKPSLPDEVFLYALVGFWRTLFGTRRSFSVDLLTFERGSPGQVFLMDEESVIERLVRLEEITAGALRWDESSGMRQLYAPGLDSCNEIEALRRLYNRDMRGLPS